MARIRELTGKRTEHSKSWLRDDGNLETEIILGKPVHYRDPAGRLNEYGLVYVSDISAQGFDHVVTEAPYRFRLARIAKGPQRFEANNGRLTVRLVGAKAARVKIDGRAATYPEAWSNVDLIRRIDEYGVKTEMILKTPSAQRVFDFEMEVENAVPYIEGGVVVYRDVAGNEVFRHPKGWMVDAAGTISHGVTYSLHDDNGKQILRTSLDEAWLDDPARAWPVTVDPTTTIQPDGATGNDAEISYHFPDANRGQESRLRVGSVDGETCRSLIYFPISGIPGGAIVLSATMTLVCYNTGDSNSYPVQVYISQGSYAEGTVTYNTQPAQEGSSTASTNVSSTGSYNWNLTQAVQDWVNGVKTNYGICLRLSPENYAGKDFYSSEWGVVADRPKLVIVWTQKPTASGLTPGNTTGDPTKINTLVPRLSWTFQDPDVGDTQAGYQVIITRDSDGVVVRDTGQVASANQYYDVTAGTLAQGVKYRWKARVKDNNNVWGDYSSEVYFYTNRAPNPPTNLSPSSNTVIDATADNTLSWVFQDPDTGSAPESQSAYQLIIYRVSDGATILDTGKVTSSAQSRVIPAGTLVNGEDYQWKVKTWDNTNAEGAYSSLASFRTGQTPSATPDVPANGGTYAKGILTVEWSYADPEADAQHKYRVRLLQGESVLEDTDEVISADTSHLLSTVLANNTAYQWEITVWDTTGQSGTGTATFTTDFVPPPTPSLTLTPDSSQGYIGIAITNPAPGGGVPDTDRNHLYREAATEAKIRIAKDLPKNGAYDDYNVASGVVYTYTVVAVSVDETTAEGA